VPPRFRPSPLDPRFRGGDDNPFAHLPIYGLEDLGFVPRGEAGAFIAERKTAPGGKLPLNTNGGGLSYMHSGMYGMYALQESVRQMHGTAPAQIPGHQALGLSRRRRHVRRKQHDHHGERAAVSLPKAEVSLMLRSSESPAVTRTASAKFETGTPDRCGGCTLAAKVCRGRDEVRQTLSRLIPTGPRNLRRTLLNVPT
jgi:hypothetical protein